MYRLGVDVGGTFTDLLLIEERSGRTFRTKTPSTPADPSQAILTGIDLISERAGIRPGDIGRIMHGTTVATNAVLEHKGARVGLLVTEGYRQILQIARSYVPGGLAGWIVWPKPEPLVDLRDTYEIPERMGARGDVVTPLDERSVRDAVSALAASGVEAVTVALINSYANDDHEQRVAAIVRELMPGVSLSLSSQVLPEIREYERTLSTVVNAYVSPVVSRYVRNLETEVRARGVEADLLLLRSDGGLASIEASAAEPVNLLLSGPAGGVTGALWAARLSGHPDVLTLDMGGTSTDVSLIQAGTPRIARETEVGDLRVRAPSVDVRTVGAGGGSIAAVSALTGALRVGPESAGAVPGPACYGRGGTLATVTDANVVLGYLPPSLLGGEMTLDVEASRRAVQAVADAMGLPLERAAAGIIDIVNESMYGALRLVSVQQGFDPRGYALLAFGGAGPLHGNALGRLLGSWPVIIPPSPGVLNAYGDATTQLRNEASRTILRTFSGTSAAEVAGILRQLRVDAAGVLEEVGVAEGDQTVLLQVDMRYQGQGFELTVDLEEGALSGLDLEAIGARFDGEHERLFSFRLDADHEIVNLRAIVLGPADSTPPPSIEQGGADAAHARTDRTQVWVDGARREASIYDRAKLLAGNRVDGPAIVAEMDSTTLVLDGHVAEVDRYGNLLITPA
jgi:N-methylhydantoinase A